MLHRLILRIQKAIAQRLGHAHASLIGRAAADADNDAAAAILERRGNQLAGATT